MPFELSTLDLPAFAAKGARMVLKHPETGEPLRDSDGKEAALLLAGADSPQWRDAERANMVEAFNERKADDEATLTADQIARREANTRRALVAVTLGWEGLALHGDTTFSAQAADALYRMVWPAEQAAAFIRERKHFLPTSATA